MCNPELYESVINLTALSRGAAADVIWVRISAQINETF